MPAVREQIKSKEGPTLWLIEHSQCESGLKWLNLHLHTTVRSPGTEEVPPHAQCMTCSSTCRCAGGFKGHDMRLRARCSGVQRTKDVGCIACAFAYHAYVQRSRIVFLLTASYSNLHCTVTEHVTVSVSTRRSIYAYSYGAGPPSRVISTKPVSKGISCVQWYYHYNLHDLTLIVY